jgi:hypothetical protein
MKLEFLKNINEYDEHAVRLSDFNSAQATLFHNSLVHFISNKNNYLDVSALDFITPVNCRLILRITSEDIGISTTDRVNFFCDLTLGTYRVMEDLLKPFSGKESKGYQWLYDIDTPIGFLLSAGTDMPENE